MFDKICLILDLISKVAFKSYLIIASRLASVALFMAVLKQQGPGPEQANYVYRTMLAVNLGCGCEGKHKRTRQNNLLLNGNFRTATVNEHFSLISW